MVSYLISICRSTGRQHVINVYATPSSDCKFHDTRSGVISTLTANEHCPAYGLTMGIDDHALITGFYIPHSACFRAIKIQSYSLLGRNDRQAKRRAYVSCDIAFVLASPRFFIRRQHPIRRHVAYLQCRRHNGPVFAALPPPLSPFHSSYPLSYTHRRLLSFTLALTDYYAFAFSPTHCPFHLYRRCRSVRYPACNTHHPEA